MANLEAPGADAAGRHSWNGRDLPKVARLNSPNERAEPRKLQPRLSSLYSHQARRSDVEEGCATLSQSTVCGLLILRNCRRGKKTTTSSSHPRQNAQNILKESKSKVGFAGGACVSCALPFSVFTAAVVCASLDRVADGPHRCAAVSLAVINIAAEPDSPESSQWRPRKGREAGSLRALIGWKQPSLTPPLPPPEPVLVYVFFCWRGSTLQKVSVALPP